MADFTDEPVTNGTRVVVSDVEVSSDAGDDATYALRDVVRVTVTFSEAVAVAGAPRLKLALGAGAERWATYRRGSGTAALAFAYTVAQGDASSAGVAVLANTLALNGGAIRGVGSGRDAALAHGGRGHDAAHKVDGTLPDITPPRLSRTVVDGAKLTLAFTEAIDDAASPANGAFTVKKTPPGGTEETVGLRGSPAVEGAAVTLSLAKAVRGADTGVKVSYRKPGSDAGDRLRDESGNEVAEFSDRPVANAADTTPPRLVGGEVDGGTMILYFSEPLDPQGTAGTFRLAMLLSDGERSTFLASSDVEISGNTVTVGLGYGMRAKAGEPYNYVWFFYRPSDPASERLRDLAGNEVRSGQGLQLNNLTGAPTVKGVEVSSHGGADRTYGQGETIRVRLTFNKRVTVTGTPRVKIDFSSGAGDEKWADYASGSGTTVLEFAYTVAQGDASREGVAVLANTLAVNGGAIESELTAGEHAALAHAGLNHDPKHRVDTTPATPFAASVNRATLALIFDKPLGAAASLVNGAFTVKKTPQGGAEETVSLSGAPAIDGATVTLTLANAVLDTDTDVKVSYTKPTSGTGNRLRDESGKEVPSFTDKSVKNVTGDTTPPRLVRGEIDGGTMTLYFSETLDPDSVGGVFRVMFRHVHGHRISTQATGNVELSGSAVTVGLGDGMRAKAGEQHNTAHYIKPADPGATQLRDLAGNTVRTPHGRSDGSAYTRYVILDNLTGPPRVTGVTVSSDAGADRTYSRGETIQVTATFSEAVAVTGTPRVKIDFSSEAGDEQWADYASGSGTKMLEFAYTVAQGDASSAGVAVLANTLALNGGTIESASVAGESANLAHAKRDHDPAHKVDARPPTLSAARVDGATLTLTFDEALGAAASLKNDAFSVKRTPQGGTEETVSLKRVPAFSGPTVILALAFADAVPSTDTDVKVSYTRPTSGTGNRLRDKAGNEVASFVEEPVTNGTRVMVSGERISSHAGDDDTYGLGEKIRVLLIFTEAVAVTGAPRLKIDFSSETGDEKWAVYESGGGTPNLEFAYTVVDGDHSTQGVAVLPNTLELDGGTIRAVGSNKDADLSHGGLHGLSHNVAHKVDWRPTLSVADARANEGTDAAAAFEVSLSRAAAGTVTVDYATADGTATAGADYTAASGTLTFAAGETAKTVSVPVLDDSLDEDEETFTLRLSNARGGWITDGEATGTITNDDPLQKLWLSRFGRTVASHVTDAVSDRLAAPLAGAQVTVAGQRVDLAQAEDGAALTQALTGLARAFGASKSPALGDGPDGFETGPGSGPGQARAGDWPGTGGAPARRMSGRELLLGSAFHLAAEGDGTGPGLAAWGRVTAGGFDGEAPADAGSVRIDGDVATGILGADAEWDRLLAGVAVSVSEGEGRFDQPGVDTGTIESAMTAVSPYARLMLNERLSVWGLAGWGTGEMTIVQAANEDTGQPERVSRSDLEMRLAAVGGRGALMEADETGGIDLALKADAFWVETEAEAVSNEGATTAAASRVRLALEGSRAFRMDGGPGSGSGTGGTLTPGVELGLRHDGGDAETGTGVELGGRVSWEDPETGLGVEARLRSLIAHEDSDYREWGASGSVRLAPGERGRGLSFSLSPTWGVASSGVERLWGAQDAGGLAPGHEYEAGQRLDGELGYGLGLFGGRFTGTPNVGFGLSDTAREVRVGWRLTAPGDPGFAVHLDATRREAANGNEPSEHGVLLRGAIRW